LNERLSSRTPQALLPLVQQPAVDSFLDWMFFIVGGASAVWLAALLFGESFTLGWGQIWFFLVFWVLLAYLVLPRLHRILTTIYVPDYFIGRARTSDGLLGDPVNRALMGDADQLVAAVQRNHQLGARRGIAGDMARERVDIGDALGLARAGGGATDALAQGDAHAGGQALEGPDHQLPAVPEIEADPIEARQRMEKQRSQVGRIRRAVGFAMQQAARLVGELLVLFDFGAAEGGAGEHGNLSGAPV